MRARIVVGMAAGSSARRFFSRGALLWALFPLAAEAQPRPAQAPRSAPADKTGKKDERPPLILKLEQRGERAGAPLQAEIELDWVGPQVLEGTLRFEFFQGNRELGSYDMAEVALAAGTQRFAAMFPAMSVREPGQYVTARAQFLGRKAKRFFLDPQLLSVPNLNQRSLLVCAPDPDPGALGGPSRALRFEGWNPIPRDRSVITSFVRPPELSASPLGYLPFDL